MREVNFTVLNADVEEINYSFESVNKFVSGVRNNSEIDTAISLDNELVNFSVETAILDKSYFKTVNDLFLFCKGIVYARCD